MHIFCKSKLCLTFGYHIVKWATLFKAVLPYWFTNQFTNQLSMQTYYRYSNYIMFPEKKTSFAYLMAKVIWSGQFLIRHWLAYHLLKDAYIEPPKRFFKFFFEYSSQEPSKGKLFYLPNFLWMELFPIIWDFILNIHPWIKGKEG